MQVVLSSDAVAALRVPVTLLTLHLKTPDGLVRDVVLELSQSSLGALLSDFSNINHVLAATQA